MDVDMAVHGIPELYMAARAGISKIGVDAVAGGIPEVRALEEGPPH